MINIKELILNNRFLSGHQRTVKLKKNIIASLLIQGISVVIGFFMVRVSLGYLDQTKYGVWLTISSLLVWFNFFEIGLGNGLKNKLAEALAKKDFELGKIYVSTTYAILSIIIGIVFVIFIIVNNFIDWTIILNTETNLAKELSSLALIVFSFFFLRFVLKLVGIVLVADQRPAISNLFGPMGNLISLIIIYILTKISYGSLLYLGIALSGVPIIVLSIATIYFFSHDYKKISPSINSIDFKYSKELLNLGVKFFLIQITSLIFYQTSNIIISQYFGPAQVTPYNIAYKYFSTIIMLFTIIINPFWAAFTEAWVIEDVLWVKRAINKLLFVWGGMVLLSVFMFFISDQFFDLWIGTELMQSIEISLTLKLSLIIYFTLLTFGGVFNMFINGVGKIRLQGITLLFGALLFIPLVILFINVFNWGIESVVIAMILTNIYHPIIAPLQYYKLVNKKADGIWDR